MAHFAFLDENNVVVEVIVGSDEPNINWELVYGNFRGLTCKQTSYNTRGNTHALGGVPFRKNYAGIGYTYDQVRDAFIPPCPSPLATLDENTCLWIIPNDGNHNDMVNT